MNQNHLSDDQLLDVCLGATAAPEQAHLAGCADCEQRRSRLAGMLSDVAGVMNAEVDAAFPPERLTRQQARILQRIDQEGRPGRVITFPVGQAQASTSVLRTSPTTRWIAAAAAAAFVIGVLAGQHIPRDFRNARAQVAVVHPAAAAPTGTTLRASAPLTPSDDEFLGEVETAVQSAGPAVLRRIDALTPRAWDVEVGQ